jgi:hypothetical protein
MQRISVVHICIYTHSYTYIHTYTLRLVLFSPHPLTLLFPPQCKRFFSSHHTYFFTSITLILVLTTSAWIIHPPVYMHFHAICNANKQNEILSYTLCVHGSSHIISHINRHKFFSSNLSMSEWHISNFAIFQRYRSNFFSIRMHIIITHASPLSSTLYWFFPWW